MGVICGPAKTVSIDTREFRCDAEAEVTIIGGGFSNTRMMNGDGSSRVQKAVVPFKVSGLVVEIDPDNEDFEFIEAVKDGRRDVPITVTMADDNVYGGVGNLEGELSYSLNNGAASFELSGEGKPKKQ